MAPVSTTPSHLLLLPAPPSAISNKSLDAAYRPSLAAVLEQIASSIRNESTGAHLDIALPFPYLLQHKEKARGQLYTPTQRLVAGVYKLICVLAAKQGINVEDESGIDARVILVACPRGYDDSSVEDIAFGPVVSIRQLASCQRPWQSLFVVEGADGEKLLRQFSSHHDPRAPVRRVPGGAIKVEERASSHAASSAKAVTAVAVRHSSIAVGGTWDHIHIGHKLLLTMFAFMLEPPLTRHPHGSSSSGRSLTIGITGDELLVNKKFADALQDWPARQRSTVDFLRAIMDFHTPLPLGASAEADHVQLTSLSQPWPNGHAVHVRLGDVLLLKCVRISDPFGPTITDESISALVLSGETRSGGQAVNQKRIERGWPALEVFEVDVLDADESAGADDAKTGGVPQADVAASFVSKLSSTSIRKALSEKTRIKSKA